MSMMYLKDQLKVNLSKTTTLGNQLVLCQLERLSSHERLIDLRQIKKYKLFKPVP